MKPRRLRALFDTDIFAWQLFGGVSRYFVELMRALPAEGVDPRIVAPLSFNHYLGERRVPGHVGLSLPERQIGRLSHFLVRELLRATDEVSSRLPIYDVLHHTFYRRRLPHARRTVVTALDMIPELFPEFLPNGNPHVGKLEAFSSASVIVACSETTKLDVQRVWPSLTTPIEVVPLGIDAGFFKRHAVGAEGRHVLFVGTRDGYKDFPTFAVAMVPLLLEDPELSVVCAGGGAFTPEELRPFVEAGVARQVSQRRADDKELAVLYRSALAFAFPSRYEGFGLPILEAFASGCPLALARASCFPDIADDAAEYFEPNDAESMREAIRRLVRDSERRRELRRLGLARLTNYSWERTAMLTAAAYRRAVEESK